jgi:hypothetical protein
VTIATPARQIPSVRRFTPEPAAISPELILRLQKYRDPQRAPRAVRDTATVVAAEASSLLAPEAVLWRGPVSENDPTGRVRLGEECRLQSRALARLLAGCAEAYVLVLTVGSAIEERAKSMLEAQMLLEGFLMDTAAWAALVPLARGVRRHLIGQERTAGRSVTHRLAPGYLDWPVTEQPTLLGVFGDTPLPVRVTEAAWMLPVKSISGVFGVVDAR